VSIRGLFLCRLHGQRGRRIENQFHQGANNIKQSAVNKAHQAAFAIPGGQKHVQKYFLAWTAIVQPPRVMWRHDSMVAPAGNIRREDGKDGSATASASLRPVPFRHYTS
jgi:hypothetical protein